MELTEIILQEPHPDTGLQVARQFIGLADADKENEIIQVKYYEYQKKLDGSPYEPTRRKKNYVLNGSHFAEWYNYIITQQLVGAKLGQNLIEGEASLRLSDTTKIPIDAPDGYVIPED